MVWKKIRDPDPLHGIFTTKFTTIDNDDCLLSSVLSRITRHKQPNI